MNIETLTTVLGIGLIVTILIRLVTGWTLAGFLVNFLLACAGGIGGWFAQMHLGLPPLLSFPFPNGQVAVPVIWPTLGALVAGFIGGQLWRPVRTRRRVR